jgi:chemotaxis-related protein WspB
MLVLMCEAGESRYAIDCSCVEEVVACVRLEAVAKAADWLAGMFAYRGRAVAVVDLTLLTSGRPSVRRWNSRIILARFELQGVPPLLGLLAERVTTAAIRLPADATPHEDAAPSPWGRVLMDERGMYQLLDPRLLFSQDRRRALQTILAGSCT